MSALTFVAEIALFPYTFAPTGWAWCNGQLLPISQNTALFSLLGTYYGGDGRSTFALPDLNGRVALGQGQGPGLSDHWLGEQGGVDRVTLLPSEMPSHVHTTAAVNGSAASPSPAVAVPATGEAALFHSSGSTTNPLSPVGGGQPHNNLQPYLTLHYAIALQGVFPPRP